MLVLVINSGSSSLKYQLRELADDGTDAPVPVLAQGLVERIGVPGSGVPDHAAALEQVEAELAEATGGRTIDAAGHRVVHGGERFTAPARVTNEVIRAIERLAPLAPLHNPAAAQGLRAMAERWPDMPQVVVFDTSFHQTMPREAWQYALPDEVYTEHGIRRYGFHGTSHDLVTGLAAEHLGIPRGEFRAVVLHLGNGASATAIRDGVSVDTSMGYTPLAGLVMGTRSGDIDPGIIFHLVRQGGMSIDEIDNLLNKQSGVKGISGVNDFRTLREHIDNGDEDAWLAYNIYIHQLRRFIGAYMIALGRVDAITFTAGVGENDTEVRQDSLYNLDMYGIHFDKERNLVRSDQPRMISTEDSPVKVFVVPTNEELAIAQKSAEIAAMAREAGLYK